MYRVVNWFEAPGATDPLSIAGLAHLWFVTIHPFDDGTPGASPYSAGNGIAS
jgi:Fic family protein